jgi:ribosome-associated protein
MAPAVEKENRMATKKKTPSKKTAAKKPSKKAPARSKVAKKKVAKKAAPKKAAPKKASKKVAAKSTAKTPANTRARRPATEKPAKKLPPSKAQKAAALLAAKKAAALKKADRKPKKSDRKKPAPKTPAQRKVAAAPKKAAPKKAAPKKAAPKKAARDDGDTFSEVILTGEVVALPGKAKNEKADKPAKPAPDAAPQKVAKAAPKKVELGDPAHDLAQLCAAVALEKKAEDVVILEVTQLTTYADCFVVCGAPSERQVQGIARALEDEMKKIGRRAVSTEGLEQGHWVLVDFGAVVVHIFVQNARQYYDLEGFWTDAPRIDVDEKRGIGLSKLLQEEFNEAMAEAQGESQSA